MWEQFLMDLRACGFLISQPGPARALPSPRRMFVGNLLTWMIEPFFRLITWTRKPNHHRRLAGGMPTPEAAQRAIRGAGDGSRLRAILGSCRLP